MESSYTYDIALSFASEERDYVKDVADKLKEHNVKVFYDDFEKASLWGKNLYDHLQEIYQKKAKYTIIFISENYSKKLWTNFERKSAQARAFSENYEYILPARFDNTEIPGILPTLGYINLNDYSPQSFAEIIIEKLNQEEIKLEPSPIKTPIKPFIVPESRNKFYIEPSSIINKIYTKFNSYKDNNDPKYVVLAGLGGIGKTQTALEYAYRNIENYNFILWINTISKIDAINHIIDSAQIISKYLHPVNEKINSLAEAILILENLKGGLLIFDNVDELESILGLIPKRGDNHILITSRVQNWDRLGILEPFIIHEFNDLEASRFLIERTGKKKEFYSDRNTTLLLAKELGNLPLALEQAAAYIVLNKIDTKSYLLNYTKYKLAVLEKSKSTATNYQLSVATTWKINIEEIEEKHKASSDVLKICYFLKPNNIPVELFFSNSSLIGEDFLSTTQKAESNIELCVKEILAPLIGLSLIKYNNDNTISIHPLVQHVGKEDFSELVLSQMYIRVVQLVAASIPEYSSANMKKWDRIIPQAIYLSDFIKTEKIEIKESGSLLNEIGVYLMRQSYYNEAYNFYFESLSLRERCLDENNPDLGESYLNLSSYLSLIKEEHHSAFYYGEKALEIYKKAGIKHIDQLIESVANIGSIHNNLGNFKEAESIFEIAIKLSHEYSQSRLHFYYIILANIKLRNDDFEAAKLLYEEAIQLMPQGLDFVEAAGQLAYLYLKQGETNKSLQLHKEAIRQSIFFVGETNEVTIRAKCRLAGHYETCGDSKKAIDIYSGAVKSLEKDFGLFSARLIWPLEGLKSLLETIGHESEVAKLIDRIDYIKSKQT